MRGIQCAQAGRACVGLGTDCILHLAQPAIALRPVPHLMSMQNLCALLDAHEVRVYSALWTCVKHGRLFINSSHYRLGGIRLPHAYAKYMHA